MKKRFLFFAYVLTGGAVFCAFAKTQSKAFNFERAETFSSASFYFPKNFEGKFWSDSSYVFSHGAKLRFTGIELRYFNSCGKTLGTDLKENSFGENFSKRRWSFSFDARAFEKSVDAKMIFGSLGYSSKMKNPALSATPNPFVSALDDAQGLGVSLPSKFSAKKDPALFLHAAFHFLEKFSLKKIRFLPLQLQIFGTSGPEKFARFPYVMNARGGFLYKNFFKFSAGLWFERYCVEQNGTADIYWWSEIPTHNFSVFNSVMSEVVFSLPHLKNKFIFGATENAQSLGRFWFRDEALFKMDIAQNTQFSFAGQFFLSDNVFYKKQIPLVTTSNAKKYSLWQTKGAAEFSFLFPNKRWLKIGMGGFLEEKIFDYATKNENVRTDAKISLGAKFSSTKNSAKITGTASEINVKRVLKEGEKVDIPKISISAAYLHKFKNKSSLGIFAGASIKKQHNEKNEFLQNVRINYTPCAQFLKSVSVGVSATEKNNYNKFEPFAKAAFLFNLKKIKINADICINANLKIEE